MRAESGCRGRGGRQEAVGEEEDRKERAGGGGTTIHRSPLSSSAVSLREERRWVGWRGGGADIILLPLVCEGVGPLERCVQASGRETPSQGRFKTTRNPKTTTATLKSQSGDFWKPTSLGRWTQYLN